MGGKGTQPKMMKIQVPTSGEQLMGFSVSEFNLCEGTVCTTGKNPAHSSARRIETSTG